MDRFVIFFCNKRTVSICLIRISISPFWFCLDARLCQNLIVRLSSKKCLPSTVTNSRLRLKRGLGLYYNSKNTRALGRRRPPPRQLLPKTPNPILNSYNSLITHWQLSLLLKLNCNPACSRLTNNYYYGLITLAGLKQVILDSRVRSSTYHNGNENKKLSWRWQPARRV